MAPTKIVTKEELLEYIGPWEVLWYAIHWPDNEDENEEYDFISLNVELGCHFRIVDDHKVLKLTVDINNLSKAEITQLIIDVNNKAFLGWQEVFNDMVEDRLKDIEEIWSNK